MDINSLQQEIDSISRPEIRELVIRCLEHAPDYFWRIPASSTGNHHPSFALGEGGLVRHTKAAVRIALELIPSWYVYLPGYEPIKPDRRDCIIAALILHDTCKRGVPDTGKTDTGHPIIPRRYYLPFRDLAPHYYDWIMSLVARHMGPWGPEWPVTSDMTDWKLVHLADFLASRRWVQANGLLETETT